MAQIEYEKVKVIVENNLRNAGLSGGVLENGWKDNVTIDGTDYPQPFGLQGLRDVIAKSIVDTLTNATVIGTPTTGSSVPGTGVVSTDTSTINITLGSLSGSKEAIRVGDETTIDATSDANFMKWITAVDTFIMTCIAVVGPATASIVGTAATTYKGVTAGIPPTKAVAKATKGSTTVKIGD